MSTYTELLVEEKNAIDAKITALYGFLQSPPAALAREDQVLLHEQQLTMQRYSRVLSQRLARAGVVSPAPRRREMAAVHPRPTLVR